MCREDVEPDDCNSKPSSRSQAVLLACREFVGSQLNSPIAGHDRYSLISFNDTALTHFPCVPAKVAWQLLCGAIDLSPQLGTSFVAALSAVDELFRQGKIDAGGDVHIFFLSDGRPGDCLEGC
eukprot:gnl/TRDRNA2_/TRDRNA2_140047_c2_seq1.p2 gnl/TRDRNA2_/TRDRNA2_140047_c2~~gnl/TRDRNA2_/TRDRNA2_140047_c2_seq1.p2  ORF type:complete len:132 (+),score=18.17 gnl/TRDRNA2_/TRDRNA2_140047_c2_seq1:30-398(+)